jgi:hypothetical protein
MGRKILFGVLGVVIVLILLIIGAFWNGQALVDIFIILAALTSLVAFALLGYAALQVIDLVKEVRGEVHTLVGTAQDTMTEVQGTARFISDNLVQPVSQAVGFVSAARATARSFTEPLYKRKS